MVTLEMTEHCHIPAVFIYRTES